MKFINIFVSIVLSAGLFFILRLSSYPQLDDPNHCNYAAAEFLSQTQVGNPDSISFQWKSRIAACKLSACWYNLWNGKISFPSIFASYYTVCFWLMMVCLTFMLEDPLISMLGVFASVVCCTPGYFCPFIMPWDLLTMLFFTMAILAFQRGQFLALGLLIFFGAFLKETMLVASLLFLWRPVDGRFRWLIRLVVIACLFASTQAISSALTHAPHLSWMYSIHRFTPFSAWHLWPALFANAGSLLPLPFILWKKRDWPMLTVVLAFMAGNLGNNLEWGSFAEFRDWLELAPIGWITISTL